MFFGRRCVRLPKDDDGSSFEKLPPEILSKIFSNLQHSTRQSVRRVCKRWYFVISTIYKIHLELDSRNWKILSKCCAKYISLAIRGVAAPLLTGAELKLGVVPLCDRLIHLEFSGIVSYKNIKKALIFCHRLESLSFNRIKFKKKRQTAIASIWWGGICGKTLRARSGIYFQADETQAALLPELKEMKFTLTGLDPDELRLLHFLSAIVNKGGLRLFKFVVNVGIFFNEVPEVSYFELIKEIIASNAQSLTTIYLDCDFPESRDPTPQWDCRTFSACVNLENLTLYHWQCRQSRCMVNFNRIHLCPKLIGFEHLPPNIKTLSTTMTILLPGESLTEFHFANLRKLEELEMNCIPWFLTADGYIKRVNRNRFNHLLDELPKLKKIAGFVKEKYYDTANEQLQSVSMDFMNSFRTHIRRDWYYDHSVISMKIRRYTDATTDTSED